MITNIIRNWVMGLWGELIPIDVDRTLKYRDGECMVDVTEAMEGQYLTVEEVKNSPTKTLVIVGAGEYANTEYGRRFTLDVNIDGKKKVWRPNRDSVKNLAGTYGRESSLWIGKQAKLTIVNISGKETVLAVPEDTTEERVFEGGQ